MRAAGVWGGASVFCGDSWADGQELANLERSFWLNASLAAPKLGYWGRDFGPPQAPTQEQIANAARVLVESADPNRLYLVHHRELAFAETARIFRDWRAACPAGVEIVPAVVLRMYDADSQAVFSAEELEKMLAFWKGEIGARRVGVYDVLPGRDQGPGLQRMEVWFPQGLVRLGLQPGEPLDAPFTAAVQDTWSAFCHGLTHEDWQDRGFGRDTLRGWVAARNGSSKPIAYDLIAVAWDYADTRRGEYPGYDDARKNRPLPPGRNLLAAREILAVAKTGVLAGFSADLLILELNSETSEHDGKESFYTQLKAGRRYEGFYAVPWREIGEIFQALSRGEHPAREAY